MFLPRPTGRIGLLMLAALLLLTAASSFFLPRSAGATAGDGTPGDPNIRYYGRWDTSAPTVYKSYYGGAYFKVNFTGTTVKIKLGGPVNLQVSIDNGPDTAYPSANGTVNLTPTPLSGGVHTLRVATTYAQYDVMSFQGLVLDAGATTVQPSVRPRLIEFVGDSITAAYQNTKGAVSGFAWLAAEAVNADHTQVAYPGVCLQNGIQCYSPNPVGMSSHYFKTKTVREATYGTVLPDWDFTTYTPDVVVINLGTNDRAFQVTDADFQATYSAFLQGIRAKLPDAAILVMRTFGGYKAAPTLAAVNDRIAAGDANVHYVDTTGWLSGADFADGVHPSDAGHAKAAGLLAPILRAHLPENLALNKPATASSNAAYAGLSVDGKPWSRWGSAYANNEWYKVDLGSVRTVSKAVIDWEAAYDTAYSIQVSTDDSTYTTVYSTTSGGGGTETITFPPASARYVKLLCTTRATPYGSSFWELELYE
ncbi:discoidin domain-containing protein [Paenibacillus flagellatus]|uniref:F5/8 type C domain-containing protein n=1 Tax=Paenibacillus flagellatus TaxID=2211139 RepID=A0A2V5KXZ8_9BACL|nr:discoidin domain-containing protein [Paenibacillus flagellatus]PYI57447.1 hypothetical protein DLM86_03145 [Paenibacillus flagellatus]